MNVAAVLYYMHVDESPHYNSFDVPRFKPERSRRHDMMLTAMDTLGVHTDKLGDSTGRLSSLSA